MGLRQLRSYVFNHLPGVAGTKIALETAEGHSDHVAVMEFSSKVPA